MAFDRRLFYHFDWVVFALTTALAGVGLISVISASYAGPHHLWNGLVLRQVIWIAAGALAMVLVVVMDYRTLATYAYPLYVAVVGLLAAVAAVGQATGGSRRWISLGFFNLEPSELAKLAVILVLVRYLREPPPAGGLKLRH